MNIYLLTFISALISMHLFYYSAAATLTTTAGRSLSIDIIDAVHDHLSNDSLLATSLEQYRLLYIASDWKKQLQARFNPAATMPSDLLAQLRKIFLNEHSFISLNTKGISISFATIEEIQYFFQGSPTLHDYSTSGFTILYQIQQNFKSKTISFQHVKITIGLIDTQSIFESNIYNIPRLMFTSIKVQIAPVKSLRPIDVKRMLKIFDKVFRSLTKGFKALEGLSPTVNAKFALPEANDQGNGLQVIQFHRSLSELAIISILENLNLSESATITLPFKIQNLPANISRNPLRIKRTDMNVSDREGRRTSRVVIMLRHYDIILSDIFSILFVLLLQGFMFYSHWFST